MWLKGKKHKIGFKGIDSVISHQMSIPYVAQFEPIDRCEICNKKFDDIKPEFVVFKNKKGTCGSCQQNCQQLKFLGT